METIADIFDEIFETGALIVKPAQALEIARCQRDLHDVEVPALPAEYIEFLKIANGVAWNGFEFFGTYQVTVNKTGYVLSDIVSYNDKIRGMKKNLGNKIVIGKFDDDMYLFDADTSTYKAVDSLTLIVIDEYASFEELFLSNLSDNIDYADDDEDDISNESEGN